MRTITLEEYASLSRPECEWVVQGMIPKPGFVILAGPPKSGKSYLAIQLALAIAKGQEFLGHPTEKHTVLYLQFDTSELVWRDRLQKLREAGVDITGDVRMIDPAFQPTWVNIQRQDTQVALSAAIQESAADVVVIDVLREIHTADENDSTQMKVVCDILRSLTYGRTVVLIHHSRKLTFMDERDPVQVHRGSSYITGMADAVWLLDRKHLYIKSRFDKDMTIELRQGTSHLFYRVTPVAHSPVVQPVVGLPPLPTSVLVPRPVESPSPALSLPMSARLRAYE